MHEALLLPYSPGCSRFLSREGEEYHDLHHNMLARLNLHNVGRSGIGACSARFRLPKNPSPLPLLPEELPARYNLAQRLPLSQGEPLA